MTFPLPPQQQRALIRHLASLVILGGIFGLTVGAGQVAPSAGARSSPPPAAGPPAELPRPLAPVKHPPDNPATAAKVALGKRLFFDPRLSRNDRLSCATCHEPEKGFANGKRFAAGIDGRPGRRHVPSLLNVGHSAPLFWDGRAATLEEQALMPIENPAEMDLARGALAEKLNAIADYRRDFQQVFGGPATPARVARALAAYERTICSSATPFDRYLGGDAGALSPRARKGMELFFGRARCAVCHQGARLTDNRFHNIGTADPDLPADPGRRSVTGRLADHGAFRTPQLRDVARTAPYMHNGKFAALRDVVVHYNFGGVTGEENVHRDEALEVLYLSEDEVDDLVTFLRVGLASEPAGRETPVD